MYAIAEPYCIMDDRVHYNARKNFYFDEVDDLLPDIYLHSGRTDGSGGHRDWLNRSRLGGYHYHHKLPAHLHPNGKCPYVNTKIRSIINPYTGKKISIGVPDIFENVSYFSLDLVVKALTADDELDTEYYGDTGGAFFACPAGDSTKENLGEEISFTYPKDSLGIEDSVDFESDNGNIKLFAASDGTSTEAYVSLEAVREYMTRGGYFTDFSDNGTGIWKFTVRKPIVHIFPLIPPEGRDFLCTADEIIVQASIENVAWAKLVVGNNVNGYIDGFEECIEDLENETLVLFKKFKLARNVVGNLSIQNGSLRIKVLGHTGGTAISADTDSETCADTVTIQVIHLKTVDDMGLNLIANMERNLDYIEYDEETGEILSIPTIGFDLGYGHDVSQNPVDFIQDSLTASEALKLLRDDIKKLEIEKAIAVDIKAGFYQEQFNALATLRYNIGKLGEVDGLLEYLERGDHKRGELKNLIYAYYDGQIIKYPELETSRQGWYNRTERFLDVFFDANYGYMPIDAVNGKVILN